MGPHLPLVIRTSSRVTGPGLPAPGVAPVRAATVTRARRAGTSVPIVGNAGSRVNT